MPSPYIRNAWYVAAFNHEVGRQLIERWMLDEPLVLYRTEAGQAVALANRCAHRRYPLSRGRLVGDCVECGYHGFTFDAAGACVAIPAQETIPAQARVRAYPVMERAGWVWVWMGQPDLADEAMIPECHWLDSSGRMNFTGSFEVKARYELMVENLLDLTHLTYIHVDSIGNQYYARAPITAETDGAKVRVKRRICGVELPPFHARTMGLENPVDRWNVTEYAPPSFVIVNVGASSQRDPGIVKENKVINAITPRTRNTHTYFWGFSFGYGTDLEHTRASVTRVLSEDVAAVEAQEIMIASDREDAPEFSALTDAGVMRARRLRAELIRAESAAAQLDAKSQRSALAPEPQ
jgi:phenylpropionate dioxygenase-like ring-hydroxylating dioxygenase large terminal subunit